MIIKLKDIFIGNTNGDDEATKKQFIDLFYNGNNKYDDIMTNNLKFIISGQKGTGKTILGRYIEAKNDTGNTTCKIINKNIITMQKLLEIGYKDLKPDEYVHFFKWVTFREISKCILNKRIKFKNINYKLKDYISYKRSCGKLSRFFKIRYPKGNFHSKNYIKEEELSSQFGIEDTISDFKSLIQSKQKKSSSYELKNYYEVLYEIENLVLKCLKFINVIIIFDDLDELELKFDNESPKISILLELINAIKEINSNIKQNKLGKSKCILLIRSDILMQLNKFSNNLNKILTDCEVNLYWIDKHYNYPYEHMLMEMILNKIKVECPSLRNYTNKELYGALFPAKIDGKDMVSYLIDYSFGRPRDLITYLNIILDSNPNANQITSAMIANCKKDYSDKFCQELYNELRIHFDVKYVDELFLLLKNLKRKSFDINDITDHFNTNKLNYPNIATINIALSDLYKFGIIGNSWSKGNKQLYSWSYRKDGSKEIDFTKRFTVHYALRNYLLL